MTATEDRPAPPPPIALAYATPDARARPGVALWLSAAVVWAAFGSLLWLLARAALTTTGAEAGLAYVMALTCVAAIAIEWGAVVGRSTRAAWGVAVVAGFVAAPWWVLAAFGALSLLDWGRRTPTRAAVVDELMLIGFASLFTTIAVSHAAWATRLRRERTFSRGGGDA